MSYYEHLQRMSLLCQEASHSATNPEFQLLWLSKSIQLYEKSLSLSLEEAEQKIDLITKAVYHG